MYESINCVRDILLIAEKCTFQKPAYIQDVKANLCDYFDSDIVNTCYELYNSGCINAVIKRHTENGTVVKQIKGITPQGRILLDKIRDMSTLNALKKQLPDIAFRAINVLIQQLLA